MSPDSGVNFIVQGSGPPVVLIHGLASSWQDFVYLLPELVSRGYTAYAPDLLGHGDSPKPEDPSLYHMEQIYLHLLSWLDDQHLSEPPVLVGHSLGGYMSLMHAIRHPGKVRQMVLIDPFFQYSQLSWIIRLVSHQPLWMDKALGLTPNWVINTAIRIYPDKGVRISSEIRQRMAADYKRTSPHFAHISRDVADLSASLGQVSVPTLVIWGEHDETLRPDSFPRLVRAIPNACGHPIPGAGHHPHLSQPELVNRLTLEFLERLP